MASMDQAAAGSADGDVSPTDTIGPGFPANSKMRKRTKTGCLTCRKRRIKCGEERPTCANCIKSKRQCEGYNQRVIFKPPMGDWPNHPGVVSTLQYHNSTLPGTRAASYRPAQTATQSPESTLTSIQPRPLTHFEYSNDAGPTMNGQQAFVGVTPPYGQDPNFQQPLSSPLHQQPLVSPHQVPTPTSATSYFPQPSPIHGAFRGQYGQGANASYPEPQRYQQPQYQEPPSPYDAHSNRKQSVSQAAQPSLYYHQHQSASRPEEATAYMPQPLVSPHSDQFPAHYPEHRPPSLHRHGSQIQAQLQHPHVSATAFGQAGGYTLPLAVPLADPSRSTFQPAQIPQHDVTSDVQYMPQHAVYEQPSAVPQAEEKQPQILLSGFGGVDHISPTQALDEAAVEDMDDDYWDVYSDEEMLDSTNEQSQEAAILSRDFSLIRRIHLENTSELAVRRYDAFIYDGILSHYKAEQVANPLKNPKTARVFAHFIHVTGPSLSIYERNPRNPISMFEGPTPPSHQSLWTYILPLKALDHQGLLHAMLALASLHIAKLQRASVTPSYKHYAYALKRLGRSLGNPKKRLSIATLATSLLLAFYEVMTAEHVKWSTHLVGGAQLIAELDFPALTQEARRLKIAQTEHDDKIALQNPNLLTDQRHAAQRLSEGLMMPDEGLVSTIVGKKVSYDDFGRVVEDTDVKQKRRSGLFGKLDVRTYETLQDLYWFNARQDAFQSMVSGNPLITPFRKWSDCPPRAALGRPDALYGTHDHIVLLVARISDFTVRDRERKLRQVKADGGQWRPRPGMPGMATGPPSTQGPGGQFPTQTRPMGPPAHMKSTAPPGFRPPPGQSQAQEPSPPRAAQPASVGPSFYGMAPSRPPIPLPDSYANPDFKQSPETPDTPHPRFADLPSAYEAALSQWNSMSHAQATIARHLTSTEAFAPLPPELYPVAPGGNMTPFGPALVHRSYDISTLWTLLHLANILLLRSHPTMPPAAMVAAGVCAQATQPYATLIGRISAGMQIPASDDMPLSPYLGAALIETTMALFFAGVQFQATDQRSWLVNRLLDIDRRTGWASAAVIARSCETSWEKAAGLGKGAPYEHRKTRRPGEKGPIALEFDGPGGNRRAGSGVFRGMSKQDKEGQRKDSAAWQFVVGGNARQSVPWAKNLLATDEDLRLEMEGVGLGGQ